MSRYLKKFHHKTLVKSLLYAASPLLALIVSALALADSTKLGQQGAQALQKEQRSTLTTFNSEDELETFLKKLASADKRDFNKSASPPSPSVAMDGALGGFADQSAAPQKEEAESITNVQHQGVDEGDIVKKYKDYLVILRRGRLFSVNIRNQELEPISSVNAYAPSINPQGTWYDEMLISNHKVVVIGYSYERGGTEIGLFNIDDAGKLSYESTYHLRSNDYYSSRNYASRLIGNKLVFYAPLYLSFHQENLFQDFPAIRKWHEGAKPEEFERILPATKVYRPLTDSQPLTLHSVITCDLGQAEMACTSTAVLGPAGRVFYVSPSSVYVWMTSWNSQDKVSLLYQLPLDGHEPKVLKVSGSPVDQFSFLEENQHLNVLLRAQAQGDGMWNSEVAAGDTAMLRVPLSRFSSKVQVAADSEYTALPKTQGYDFQNRFVGEYLLYGDEGNTRYDRRTKTGFESGATLYAYRYRGGSPVSALQLKHSVERIEALGENALIVGNDEKSLYFTPLRLNTQPQLAPSFVQANAAQGEKRSHGFFYQSRGQDSGLLGLPIIGQNSSRHHSLSRNSASILFLSNQSLTLSKLGELTGKTQGNNNDQCQASCTDWYGNARPIFIQNRIFALLGYEIVEGSVIKGMTELKRTDFSKIIGKKRTMER